MLLFRGNVRCLNYQQFNILCLIIYTVIAYTENKVNKILTILNTAQRLDAVFFTAGCNEQVFSPKS